MRIKRLSEMVARTYITESVDETMEWCGYVRIGEWVSSNAMEVETKKLGSGCWAEYECGKNRVRIFIKDNEYDFIYYLPMSEYVKGVENEWYEAALDMLDVLLKPEAVATSFANVENVEKLVSKKYGTVTSNPGGYIRKSGRVVYFDSPISKRVVMVAFDGKTKNVLNVLTYRNTTNPTQRNVSEIKNASKMGDDELANVIIEYLF